MFYHLRRHWRRRGPHRSGLDVPRILYILYPHPHALHCPTLIYCRYLVLQLLSLSRVTHAFPCPTPILSLQAYSPPRSRTQHYAASIISYTTHYAQRECHSLLYAVCGSGRALLISPMPMFSLCTPRLPTESQLLLHYLPYLCSAFTI